MVRGIKIALILSLILNVVLIVSFVYYRNYVKTHLPDLLLSIAEAEIKHSKYILLEIESEDPAKIESLKGHLRRSINNSEKNASVMRAAVKKHYVSRKPNEL